MVLVAHTLAAIMNMASVTLRAPVEMIPSAMPGKMYELLP